MTKYLIDENLPTDLKVWSSPEFIHILDIPECHTDSEIWKYALDHSLNILTKDADFYYRYISTLRTPKIVWFKIGNMPKPTFENFISFNWSKVEELLISERFIIVYREFIETLK